VTIVKCEKCSIEFDNYSKWGTKRFCSSKCNHSRIRTEDIKQRVSQKMKGRDVANLKLLTLQERMERSRKGSLTCRLKLLTTNFNSLTIDSKKKRVILEQNGKCLICGISEWQFKPIQLAVDHINGNTLDNERTNLRGLCPNCHSQTETYCGRNRSDRITDEQLLKTLKIHKTIAGALTSLGKTRSSYNYQRCRNILKFI
jgi:5-methylcytosine-specific restriction endonuclease McrA